jgi:molybdenum cofactor cytidylyltransferase
VNRRKEAASPAAALGLEQPPGLVAIVGGGGKSSLMFALGECLPGRVVMTTTTRIFAAQMSRAAVACSLDDGDIEERLDALDSKLLVVGAVNGDRAVGVPAELPAQWLERPGVDWVVAEADGSRMRPVKAPAEHEPVVPARTRLLVAMVGIDALDAPLREVAHRPERVSAITGLAPEDVLTPEALAALLTSPEGGLKHASKAERVAVLINKAESARQRAAAREVARCILEDRGDSPGPRVERVAIGALRDGASPRWEFCASAQAGARVRFTPGDQSREGP